MLKKKVTFSSKGDRKKLKHISCELKHCENVHAEKDQQRQKVVSGEKNKSHLGSTVFKR